MNELPQRSLLWTQIMAAHHRHTEQGWNLVQLKCLSFITRLLLPVGLSEVLSCLEGHCYSKMRFRTSYISEHAYKVNPFYCSKGFCIVYRVFFICLNTEHLKIQWLSYHINKNINLQYDVKCGFMPLIAWGKQALKGCQSELVYSPPKPFIYSRGWILKLFISNLAHICIFMSTEWNPEALTVSYDLSVLFLPSAHAL